MNITIGKSESGEKITFDLQRFMETRGLIQANSGGGKSETLRTVIEGAYGQVQIIVLDTEGEFSTLREACPEFLVIGEDGDVPINIKMASLLPEKLVELQISTVIDMYELEAHERILFVKRFLDGMINLPKELWRPVLIVLDEIHLYCPQDGSVESSGSVANMATRGRKRQQALLGATQRLSKFHKDAAAELNNKLIGRTMLDTDVKRVAGELGKTVKEIQEIMRNLEPGEFFCYGPALTKEVTRIKVNRSKSKPPKVGTALAGEKIVTPDRIKKLIGKLADLPLEAAKHEKNLEDLKKENRDLKLQLSRSAKAPVAPSPVDEKKRAKELEAARAHGFADGIHAQKVADMSTIESAQTLVKTIKALGKEYEFLLAFKSKPLKQKEVDHIVGELDPTKKISSSMVHETVFKSEPSKTNIEITIEGDTKISNPQRRILQSLASLKAAGIEEAPRSMLAAFSEQSVKSSGYTKNLSTLSSAGYVQYRPGSTVALTDAGEEFIGVADEPADDDDLQERWLRIVSNPQKRILEILIPIYPKGMARSELAEKSGQSATSSGFTKNISILSSIGAVEYGANSTVKATKNLFLNGD